MHQSSSESVQGAVTSPRAVKDCYQKPRTTVLRSQKTGSHLSLISFNCKEEDLVIPVKDDRKHANHEIIPEIIP